MKEEEENNEKLMLIVRNLAHLTDSQENIQLSYWIESSDHNKQYYEQVKQIWEVSGGKPVVEKIDAAEAMTKVLVRIKNNTRKRRIWQYWQKVAAVLIIPLTIGTVLLVRQKPLNEQKVYNEAFSAIGTRSKLMLADSSLVWLNSGSSLKYPVRFTENERVVYLNGEAYFEVKSDKNHPFIVNTSDIRIRSTGTKFNVLAFDRNPVCEVTLISGKVIVEEFAENSNSTLISDLNPDQHLDYNKNTKNSNVINVDTYKYYAWKDGKIIFRNESLGDVVNEISQIFNVDESLEEILKLLKISSPIDYIEVVRNPLPDGSFPKKKILIFNKKTDL